MAVVGVILIVVAVAFVTLWKYKADIMKVIGACALPGLAYSFLCEDVMKPPTQPLKRCGCATPTAKCPDAPRTVQPTDLNPDTALVLDVRREADYAASGETIPGAMWKNPDKIDAWIGALPLTLDVVVYCGRGGSVSNSVVDRLQAAGVKARYIKGGVEAWKAAGGKAVAK